ncbi:hypothetical protein BACSP_02500 [Bacillus sp. T2.9-1]|nr:hypothetical protein BACSP_02500 [Bacillus sp. T2.9-1]
MFDYALFEFRLTFLFKIFTKSLNHSYTNSKGDPNKTSPIFSFNFKGKITFGFVYLASHLSTLKL